MSARQPVPGAAPAWTGRFGGLAPAAGCTLVVFGATLLFGGADALGIVVMLSILEVSFSFDNAVINATVLRRLSPLWQRLFLTVGIVVAVVVVRLLLPIAIVSLTTATSPLAVFHMATRDPSLYAQELQSAHPVVAALGGTFLLLIFLDFLLSRRSVLWFKPLERFTARFAGLPQLPAILALLALVVVDLAANPPHGEAVLAAGALGVVGFLLVRSLGDALQRHLPDDDEDTEAPPYDAAVPARSRRGSVAALTGRAAFVMFCYLELADASFSFDGVIGAFAITSDIVLITVGLGVGALYVRSLTVYLVRKGTLDEYVYLEHGAHYAIGSLAVMLLATERFEIPDAVIGLVGVLFIAAAVATSIPVRRAEHAHATAPPDGGPQRAIPWPAGPGDPAGAPTAEAGAAAAEPSGGRAEARARRPAPVVKLYVTAVGYVHAGPADGADVTYALPIAGPADIITPSPQRIVYIDDEERELVPVGTPAGDPAAGAD